MNCAALFLEQVKDHPNRLALSIGLEESTSFQGLLDGATRAQSLFFAAGVKPGDAVLLLDGLGIRLYSVIIALLSMGVKIILVEPWMPVNKIEQAIQAVRPKFFASTFMGFLWGSRVKAIRAIPHWLQCKDIFSSPKRSKLHLEDVPAELPGIITFTSGTTGHPKGVVRSQGYLVKQHEVFSQRLGGNHHHGTDLCIFANFVLSNLAIGRGSIVIPPSWSSGVLRRLDDLPVSQKPVTLSSGPAFLMQLMKYSNLTSLKSIHVGGALSDCWIFEKGFRLWPEAEWGHVYGGSEVEPVSVADAREAVRRSRDKGYFQTLFIGKNVEEIKPMFESSGLWVSGPHVCPEYVGDQQENLKFKRKDSNGSLWHFMGDRVQEDSSGWWYRGRASQGQEDFEMEQSVYAFLGSSKSFIHKKYLLGEGVSKNRRKILKRFPTLAGVKEVRIYRDKRHRARIDRTKSLQKGASWLVG